jgi:SAF domain
MPNPSPVSAAPPGRPPVATTAGRRPAAGRRRPTLLAAGIALVALGALTTAAVVGQVGDRRAVLAVSRAVPVGQRLAADDLTVAHVSVDPVVRPVPARDLAAVVGRVAAADLRAGSLLNGGDLTDALEPGPGEQLVPVVLGAGRLPARGLRTGDRVLVTAVPSTPGEAEPVIGGYAPIPALVTGVAPAADDGTTTVDVVVGAAVGSRVAVLSAAGQAALVLLPAGG